MIALNFPTSLLVTMPLRAMHLDPLAREGVRRSAARGTGRSSWIAVIRQQWRGVKLPSIFTAPGCSTTSMDQPPSVGRMQPLEADK
jgi:hypothetical protein